MYQVASSREHRSVIDGVKGWLKAKGELKAVRSWADDALARIRSAPPDDRLVIGKMRDLEAPGALRPGERTLYLPDRGSPKANWKQNYGALRREMRRGAPIRDATVDPQTGELIDNTGFLRAERHTLQDRGWTYDPNTTLWTAPGR